MAGNEESNRFELNIFNSHQQLLLEDDIPALNTIDHGYKEAYPISKKVDATQQQSPKENIVTKETIRSINHRYGSNPDESQLTSAVVAVVDKHTTNKKCNEKNAKVTTQEGNGKTSPKPTTKRTQKDSAGMSSNPISKRRKAPGAAKERTADRDSSCINALLSLGRDLQQQEHETSDGDDGTQIAGMSQQSDLLILPVSETQQTANQRINSSSTNSSQGSYKPPPDFWYWLPPGENIGDWDVLCGRGGESNNFIGNKKYRRVVNERKDAYRSIPLKQRKAKTAFVRGIVQHVNNCGGRFVDLDEKSGRYYVVTMEKARKKTSQALRETKELKWLEIEPKEKKVSSSKNSICPFCKQWGHKTKIAKACLRHHEWLDANASKTNKLQTTTTTTTTTTATTITGMQSTQPKNTDDEESLTLMLRNTLSQDDFVDGKVTPPPDSRSAKDVILLAHNTTQGEIVEHSIEARTPTRADLTGFTSTAV